MPNYLMVLMAVSVGGMVVLQAGSNALLGRLLGHPLSASLTSLGVSLGVVSLGLLLVRVPLPATASLGGAPWWSWLGGLFGAAYLTVAILVAPRLGPPLSSRAWWPGRCWSRRSATSSAGPVSRCAVCPGRAISAWRWWWRGYCSCNGGEEREESAGEGCQVESGLDQNLDLKL